VHDLDPNNHGVAGIPTWPSYSDSPSNFVFRVGNSEVELDNWRVPQLKFWGTIWGNLKT
jgi:hypothetical protein